MPLETITVTIGSGSANPQTKTIQINVDANSGSGTGTVSFSGAHGGLDAIQATATIAGSAYTSNVANIAWQATNGIVSLIDSMNVQGFANPGNTHTWNGLGAALSGLLTYNSLVVNQPVNNTPISGIISPDGHSGEYNLVPPHIDLVTSTGTALSAAGTSLPYSGGFVTLFRGNFVVSTAGIHTIYQFVDDSWGCYIGPNTLNGTQQPTRVGGTYTTTGENGPCPTTATGVLGSLPAWPLMGARNTAASGGVSGNQTDWMWVNFPAPGIYPFVFWWINNNDAPTFYQTTWAQGQAQQPSSGGQYYLGGVIKPIGAQGAPAATTPSGNLQLGLANGSTFVVGDTVTLNVTVSGVHYATKTYIPVLEGTSGYLNVFNDPSNPNFNYPTYNGQSVNKAAAVNSAFALSGDNTSWQGRLSLSFASPNFQLNYNGSAFDAHVDKTNITVAADDIAWFYNNTFDTFTPSTSGGGLLYGIEIDYMVNCNHVSVSPLSLNADGAQHTFVVTLVDGNGNAKPAPPQQIGAHNTGNTVNLAVTWGGGVVTNSITPNYDASGWLTGWNVVATVPSSPTNLTATMNATVSGQLTYLSGNTFVTQSVTYLNNVQVASIALAGSGLTPPVAYSFTSNSSGTTLPSSLTLTGTVYTRTNVSVNMQFYYRAQGSSTSVAIGSLQTVPQNSYTGNVSGVGTVFFKQFGVSGIATGAWPQYVNLGFVATDQNGQTCTYWDSNTYFNAAFSGGGGGGGGGGCFTAAVGIEVPAGIAEFGSLPISGVFEVKTKNGIRLAELVIHEEYKGWMIDLTGEGSKLVTLDHLMDSVGNWLAADQFYDGRYKRVWFEGTVYNLHVFDDDFDAKHYILFNGDVAHNNKIAQF